MSTRPLKFFAKNLQDTNKVSALLAQNLNPGDIVYLAGDLGAGKSALIRAVIRHLLNQPDLEVPSPTFLLALPYENSHWSLMHADLYRIKSPMELEELGLFDNPSAVVFVEWPAMGEGQMPAADIFVHMEMGPDEAGRIIDIHSQTISKSYTNLTRSAAQSTLLVPGDNLS